MFDSNVNKIFLGTDGAASSRVSQILPLRVEGSIPYSAPLMREGCSYTCPPLSIASYSFIQLSELEQCRVKKFVQNVNTTVQDFNPCLLS